MNTLNLNEFIWKELVALQKFQLSNMDMFQKEDLLNLEEDETVLEGDKEIPIEKIEKENNKNEPFKHK